MWNPTSSKTYYVTGKVGRNDLKTPILHRSPAPSEIAWSVKYSCRSVVYLTGTHCPLFDVWSEGFRIDTALFCIGDGRLFGNISGWVEGIAWFNVYKLLSPIRNISCIPFICTRSSVFTLIVLATGHKMRQTELQFAEMNALWETKRSRWKKWSPASAPDPIRIVKPD